MAPSGYMRIATRDVGFFGKSGRRILSLYALDLIWGASEGNSEGGDKTPHSALSFETGLRRSSESDSKSDPWHQGFARRRVRSLMWATRSQAVALAMEASKSLVRRRH